MVAAPIHPAVSWVLAAAAAAGPADREAPGVLAEAEPFGGSPAVRIGGDDEPLREDDFRMERSPQVEVVFGDGDDLRAHLARFETLATAMERTRTSFSAQVQLGLAAVTEAGRGCPTEALAPAYYEASERLREFRALGAELELHGEVLEGLVRAGDHGAATPDPRTRAEEAAAVRRALNRDHAEMRQSFESTLGAEAQRRGCDLARLEREGLASGEGRAAEGASAASRVPPRSRARQHRRGADEAETPPGSRPATFFVDNRACDRAIAVVVEGELLGEAAARAVAAFQTPSGRRSICLLPEGGDTTCGDAGTVRTAYIHDGWSTRLRCGDEDD